MTFQRPHYCEDYWSHLNKSDHSSQLDKDHFLHFRLLVCIIRAITGSTTKVLNIVKSTPPVHCPTTYTSCQLAPEGGSFDLFPRLQVKTFLPLIVEDPVVGSDLKRLSRCTRFLLSFHWVTKLEV